VPGRGSGFQLEDVHQELDIGRVDSHYLSHDDSPSEGGYVKIVTIVLEGRSPLSIQSDQLVNPLNEYARKIKEITRKPARSKSEADYLEIARLEFLASFYPMTDEVGGPYIPSNVLIATIRDAGKFQRLGPTIRRAVVEVDPTIPILYQGPRDLETLSKDVNFQWMTSVRTLGGGRVPRNRPIFNKWAIETALYVDEDLLDIEIFEQTLQRAGRLVGMASGRTIGRGRFTPTIKSVEDF
jgi:hypothetical protein